MVRVGEKSNSWWNEPDLLIPGKGRPPEHRESKNNARAACAILRQASKVLASMYLRLIFEVIKSSQQWNYMMQIGI